MEEFLRFFSIIQYGISRAALDRGRNPPACSSGRGRPSRSPCRPPTSHASRFPHPTGSTSRAATGGISAFGFGVHQCVAQQLARVELTVALEVFLHRDTDFTLENYEMKSETIVHGLTSLLVRAK